MLVFRVGNFGLRYLNSVLVKIVYYCDFAVMPCILLDLGGKSLLNISN